MKGLIVLTTAPRHRLHSSSHDKSTLVELPEIQAKPDLIDPEALEISPMQEQTCHKIALNISNTASVLAADELKPSPYGDHGRRTDIAALGKQLAEAYFESPEMEMKEFVTTASRSPTLVSSCLPSVLSRYTGTTLEALELPVDPAAVIKSEVNDQEQHNHGDLAEHLSDAGYEDPQVLAETQESDELSEADDEEINLLATKVVLNMTLPTKEPTPAPLTGTVGKRESEDSMIAPTNDHVITDQDAKVAQTVKLRDEAEFHYEGRAARSETRTSDPDHAPLAPIEDATDAPHASTIKQEEPEPSQSEYKPTTAQARPTLKALSASTSASRSSTKPVTKAKRPPTRTIATTAKPMPKAVTSAPPGTSATASKSRKTTLKPDSTAQSEDVLGKRKTRRSSVREEELRNARMLGQGGNALREPAN